MNIKKIAFWTVGIFVGTMILSSVLGACAGPGTGSAAPGSSAASGSYQDGSGNSNNGWLWGISGLAAGYGLGKFFNRDKAVPAYQQKQYVPAPNVKPQPKPENKNITRDDKAGKPASSLVDKGTSSPKQKPKYGSGGKKKR